MGEPSTSVLVAGSSGFIGSRLCPALVEDGHEVRAMTRHPEGYPGAGKPVHGDVADAASLHDALFGAEQTYYLVHPLGSDDFDRRDAEAAGRFGEVAAQVGSITSVV